MSREVQELPAEINLENAPYRRGTFRLTCRSPMGLQ